MTKLRATPFMIFLTVAACDSFEVRSDGDRVTVYCGGGGYEDQPLRCMKKLCTCVRIVDPSVARCVECPQDGGH